MGVPKKGKNRARKIQNRTLPTRWACDIKVAALPLVHDIFVKAYGGSRVVWGARLAGDRT